MEKIEEIGRGEYNINYLYEDNKYGSSVFRINLSSQLNLGKDQIEYEYNALKTLESSKITPIVYDYKKSGKYLPFGYLKMKYLEGRPLNYDKDLEIAAKLLSTIHNFEYKENSLLTVEKPFQAMYDEFEMMYAVYKNWNNRDLRTIFYIDYFMDILKNNNLDEKIDKASIINTELNNRNFIIGEKSYIIDWEKPIIGEAEQDIAHFMVPTTTNWKTDKILSDSEIDNFINEYQKYRKIDRKKLFKYFRFNIVRGITWCSMAKVEYSSNRTIKNMDTLEKIDKFLSEEFLSMLNKRFFEESL